MKLAILLIFMAEAALGQLLSTPSCESPIYCQGELLHTIQTARPFQDSKTFVDMKLKFTVAETLTNFEWFMNNSRSPNLTEVRQFIAENFEEFNEFEDWVPSDFTPSPGLLSKIQDDNIKTFAKNLVNIWPDLAKKVRVEVFDAPEQFSLIPVTNGFIVPGGRFKEFYYWDSYFIIKGLLLSEMKTTVKGMLENFLSFVNRFGFVPNGARVYYLNRSQPPLLTAMIYEYVKAANDTKFLQDNIVTIDKELTFWLNEKTVEIVKNNVRYRVARYNVESGSPRPESYGEDVETALYYQNYEDKQNLWANIKSAAESGHDFSSRWIVEDNGVNTGNITFLKTRRIIPVDLNAILGQAFRYLAEFYIIIGDIERAVVWWEVAEEWQKTIRHVFYHDQDGIWYDFDMELSQPRRGFYASNLVPLWAEVYQISEASAVGKRAVQYLNDNNITDFLGGVPSSLVENGEQWDFPNAWSPLQHFVVVGLHKSGDCGARKLARELGERWVQSNLLGYNQHGSMYEKYDATSPGQRGSGGEYVVQSGFGWTNGVALDFIDMFYT